MKLNVCKVIKKNLIGGCGNPGWDAECDKTIQLYDKCMKGEKCVGGKDTELHNFGNEWYLSDCTLVDKVVDHGDMV